MNISIHDLLHQYAATLNRTWAHDRSKTVGASEIGQCARKTWFSKHNSPRDEGYVDGWGAALRGRVIEDAFWVPALRQELPLDVVLLYAGEEQRTFSRGYLSATTDGLLVGVSHDDVAWCINLDCKSIDPRADISKERSAHHFQVQTQMGLIRDCTEYKPDSSILSYIDASFWDTITEFVIPFNPRIYAAAHARAEQIMTATDALELPPEGKMAGDGECDYCAWASHCAAVTVAGVPRNEAPLRGGSVLDLMLLGINERYARAASAAAEVAHSKSVESIKEFMRGNNTRRHKSGGLSASYSVTSGKATLDISAVEAAGIDLSQFYKAGNPSERLRITMNAKELVIEVRVPLSGDMFDDAAMTTKVQSIFATIRERADSEFGEGGYTLSVGTPTVREPRAPRAKKNANGPDTQPVAT